jgi:hypothetical protein
LARAFGDWCERGTSLITSSTGNGRLISGSRAASLTVCEIQVTVLSMARRGRSGGALSALGRDFGGRGSTSCIKERFRSMATLGTHPAHAVPETVKRSVTGLLRIGSAGIAQSGTSADHVHIKTFASGRRLSKTRVFEKPKNRRLNRPYRRQTGSRN